MRINIIILNWSPQIHSYHYKKKEQKEKRKTMVHLSSSSPYRTTRNYIRYYCNYHRLPWVYIVRRLEVTRFSIHKSNAIEKKEIADVGYRPPFCDDKEIDDDAADPDDAADDDDDERVLPYMVTHFVIDLTKSLFYSLFYTFYYSSLIYLSIYLSWFSTHRL